MKHVKVNLPGLAPGEVGYRVANEGGEDFFVAARWEYSRFHDGLFEFRWDVRKVDPDGKPVLDAAGNAVVGFAYENCVAEGVAAAGGIEAQKARLFAAALGGSDTVREMPRTVPHGTTEEAPRWLH